ncbi:MAG: hypothetical protein WKG00_05105 [Polyangiaceae bacterium]
MTEHEAPRPGPLDALRARMHSAMVRSAQGGEPLRIVPTALGARIEVMHIEEHVIAATRHHAAPVVATQHRAPRGRRNRLARPGRRRERPHTGARSTHHLRVAPGHLRHVRLDRVALSTCVDARPAALLAARYRHLIPGAPLVPCPAESPPHHLEQHRVVVDVPTHIRAHPSLQIAKQRHCLPPHLERQPMLHQRRIAAVARPVAAPSRRHTHLDLLDAPRPCPRHPGPLRDRSRHPAELTHRRPRQLPRRQRPIEQRKPAERTPNPDPLLGLPRPQPEHPVGILAKARVPDASVHTDPLGNEQPAAHLALLRAPVPTE